MGQTPDDGRGIHLAVIGVAGGWVCRGHLEIGGTPANAIGWRKIQANTNIDVYFCDPVCHEALRIHAVMKGHRLGSELPDDPYRIEHCSSLESGITT
jgi:hypothetical protein